MPPYPPPGYRVTFGPGPITPAVKALIWANVGMFLVMAVTPIVSPDLGVLLTSYLGLVPAAVFGQFAVWQPFTYMFLHAGLFHLLVNMLTLWMFGVDLERMWGTRFFTRYYFVTGLGAAATTLLLALLPWRLGTLMYYAPTIGASGAIYGLLLAYGLYFPDRPVYLYLFLPVPARVFVLIMGGVAFLSSISQTSGGVAHSAHLGGLIVGYVYLRRRGGRPLFNLRYHLARWRMQRARRRFDVHDGRGPGGWVH